MAILAIGEWTAASVPQGATKTHQVTGPVLGHRDNQVGHSSYSQCSESNMGEKILVTTTRRAWEVPTHTPDEAGETGPGIPGSLGNSAVPQHTHLISLHRGSRTSKTKRSEQACPRFLGRVNKITSLTLEHGTSHPASSSNGSR